MSSRLASQYASLSHEMDGADLTRQKRAVLAAINAALKTVTLDSPVFAAALNRIRDDNGDVEELRENVSSMAASFDDEYLALTAADSVDQQLMLKLFSKARLANSILYALSGDSQSYQEAIYEALASFEDPQQLSSVVSASLAG